MKIAAIVSAIASFIALTILLGEAVFFRVATEIGSLVTPIVGLIIIVLQIQNWVNIRKIELKTNSLLDLSNEAFRRVGHDQGYKEGVSQGDLVARTAKAATKLLRDAALVDVIARQAAAERTAASRPGE
jgi:hypothetical protein